MNFQIRRILLSAAVGVMAGMAAAVFLIALNAATLLRESYPWLIWLLPAAGAVIGYAYYKYGQGTDKGTGLILEQIHDPSNIIPFRMAPMVLLGTVLTHLFGGSAGREGTAVQMGASLADQLNRFFKMSPEDRKALLIAGAGAGFSAAIGAPLAGALFGLEVIQVGRLRLFALAECLVASFVAYYVCRLLGAPHSVFGPVGDVSFNALGFVAVVGAGLVFGLAANIFMRFTHWIERCQKRYIRHPAFRPVVGGVLLVILYQLEGSFRFVGLGIPVIQDYFSQSAAFLDPVYKTLFTGLTVGSGFKGGEFIPLVFIGSGLGSALSVVLPVSVSLLAALGFAAVFGAAANTPLACAVMACEIFGWHIAPYAFLACLVAYFVSGHLGIYKNQKVVRSKRDQLFWVFRRK
ncbi:voltage-gated chloride channel family protein [Bdellovibrio bacteriovorus]|uniref:voltage-gated chloride channel family protein n=1 Tax=Bdellovibrio bacteriovorus TaxID=959 RepID=UPI003A80966D